MRIQPEKTPLYVEEVKIEDQTYLDQVLNKFRNPVPSDFIQLETKNGRNYVHDASDWRDDLVCERYVFLVNGKLKYFDISVTLLEKLGLKRKEQISCSVYISPTVLNKREDIDNFGAYTIDSESDIFLDQPLTLNTLETQLTRWLEEITSLKLQLQTLKLSQTSNQKTLNSLQEDKETTNLRLQELEISLTKLKEWNNLLKFELVPLFWPHAIYTEDTPSAEVLIEKIKELFSEKDLAEDLTKLQQERDDYQAKWDAASQELDKKEEIIKDYLAIIDQLRSDNSIV